MTGKVTAVGTGGVGLHPPAAMTSHHSRHLDQPEWLIEVQTARRRECVTA